MHASAIALLGFIAWTLLLLLCIGGMRSGLVLGGKRRANDFKPTGEDVSAFSQRLCRAHANCYEAFPIVGGLLLYALATANTAVTDPLAYVVLAARLGQSLVHLASTSVPAVLVRFARFGVQIVIAGIWSVQFLTG